MTSRARTMEPLFNAYSDEEENMSTEESPEQCREYSGGADDRNDEEENRSRESSENGDGESSTNPKRNSVTVDIDLLDCVICFLPLRPPLFQCQNGHVACPSCCDRLQNKCPTCRLQIKYSRCLAFEKLVESIRVPCSNEGCKKMISYTDLRMHEEDTCTHALCFCPIPDCTFSSSINLLSSHLDDYHENVVNHLNSDGYAFVSMDRNNPFCVIRADNYEELFLLVNQSVIAGNALSMICIGPQTSDYSLKYELSLQDYRKGCSLQMKALMTMSPRKWDASTYFTDFFLLVPLNFDGSRLIGVHIDIKKENAPSAAKQRTK